MKQIKLLSVFTILLVFIFSCNKTPQDKILGQWDIEKIENPFFDDSEALNNMNKDVLDNEIFNFSDKKISKKIPATEGTWEMDEAGTKLTIKWDETDKDQQHIYDIKTLTEDSLIIVEDFEEFTVTTTFSKIK